MKNIKNTIHKYILSTKKYKKLKKNLLLMKNLYKMQLILFIWIAAI